MENMIKQFIQNSSSINADTPIRFAIYFLFLAAVFDPIGDFFGARYFALGLIYLLLFLSLLLRPNNFKAKRIYWVTFSLFCIVIPGYGLMISLFRGGLISDFKDTSYIAAGVLFGSSLIYLKDNFFKTGIEALIFALRCLSLGIIYTLIIYVGGFSLDSVYLFVEHGAAYFGEREYAGIGFYYLYFIASPMIIYLIAYEAWRFCDRPSLYGFALLALPVFALFLSGTRANMLLAIISTPLVFLWRKFGIVILLFMPVILFFLIILFKIYPVDLLDAMFSSVEYSNNAKLKLLEGYGVIFSDPINLLIGQGFNAHVWSAEFSQMVGGASKVEYTYIEMFRVFGVFIGFLFIIFLVVFTFTLDKINIYYRWFAPAFFIYLLVSIANPYIFSTNGMLPIALMAAILGQHIAYSHHSKLLD
jgi:hypothetical protein